MIPAALSLKKHVRTIANGRRFSIDVDAVDNSFVSIASKKPANEYLRALVDKSWQGIRSGCSPTLCAAGVGGTYFMKDARNKRIGVFKPQDEEMGCLNNPKGYLDGRIRGVAGGEAAFRECAAYILDHDHYAGVPATDLVVCNYPLFFNPPSSPPPSSSSSSSSIPSSVQKPFLPDENCKIGSFQEFKEHDFDTEDISPSKAARFPVNEVQKIALFDIRLFNTDRHGGNILVRRVYSPDYHKVLTTPKHRGGYGTEVDENGATQFSMDLEHEEDDEYDDDDNDDSNVSMSSLTSSTSSTSSLEGDAPPSSSSSSDVGSYELIPIDHGYTLPSTINGITDSWFEWLNWPQAKMPFTSQSKEYIAKLDAASDIALLREKFADWFPPETCRVLRCTTLWLKKGAAYDLTPYELGTRMCSLQVDVPSELETLYYEALDQTHEREGEEEGEGGGGEDKDDTLFFERLGCIMDEKMKNILILRASAPPPLSLRWTY